MGYVKSVLARIGQFSSLNRRRCHFVYAVQYSVEVSKLCCDPDRVFRLFRRSRGKHHHARRCRRRFLRNKDGMPFEPDLLAKMAQMHQDCFIRFQGASERARSYRGRVSKVCCPSTTSYTHECRKWSPPATNSFDTGS